MCTCYSLLPILAHSCSPHNFSMSTCYFLLYFLLPILAHSCSPYNFSCASVTFEIKYPFYTSTGQCRGLHLVQCENFVSVIKLHNQELSYPLSNISYADNSLEIIDLKLSSYFQGFNCFFLYDFKSPITEFNVSNVTNNLSSTQGFFNCEPNRYDFSHDVFKELYNLSFCEDYSLDYGARSDDGLPGYCTTTKNMWFVWRLAFDKDDGGAVSLLSAGFSRKWASFLDCFNCRTVAGKCSSHCRGVNPREGGSHNYRWVVAGKSEAKRKFKIIGVSLGLASFLIGSFLLILWFRWRKSSYKLFYWRKNAKHAQTIEAFLEKYQYLATKRYAYSDIKKITKSFSEKLGQGGYGSVYKGNMFDGNPVAVKVLNESKSDGEDFINEIAAIGNTSHVNIVTLRGFCVDGSKRALLYDFMPNGSLEKFICSKKPIGEASLGWEKLYEIAIGIARGLEYLHRGCNTRIVHFDIKPHNILLDQDFCPKISDFGMSKLCPPKQSIVSMRGARGTIGYIAPEVFSRTFGVVSSKSDVYSYGMMILEMFGAKNSTNARLMESSTVTTPISQPEGTLASD